MKPINDFTNEVLTKAKSVKRKNSVIKAVISILSVAVIVFLVAYSNIITFNGFNASKAFERFMQSYATESGDTSFKILNKDNAVLTVNQKVYTCALNEKNSNEFTLTSYAEEKGNSNLTVTFSGNTAKLNGELNNQMVSKTLNAVTDMKIEEGVYTMFARETTNSNLSFSDRNWFLINEKQSYVGENSYVYECKFVAVGNKVLQYTSDQISGLTEVSLFEVVPKEKFGYFAFKNTMYESENDINGLITYYRKISSGESSNYAGGEFSTELVTYESKTQKIDQSELGFHEGVSWQLNVIPSVKETRYQISLNLKLNNDGSLRFESKQSEHDFIFKNVTLGRWYNLKYGVLVVLDKGFSIFNFKAFVITPDNDDFNTGGFNETAISNIYALACYKVGYHTFNYYVTDASATIYWGSSWTEEDITPKLYYDTPYVFNGWQSSWHETGSDIERQPIIESKTTSLIFRQNGKCEVYRDGEYYLTVNYELYEYEKGKFLIEFKNKVLIFDEEFSSIRSLNIGAKRVFMNYVSVKTENEVRYSKERAMVFTLTS